jgi:hypothetical protein
MDKIVEKILITVVGAIGIGSLVSNWRLRQRIRRLESNAQTLAGLDDNVVKMFKATAEMMTAMGPENAARVSQMGHEIIANPERLKAAQEAVREAADRDRETNPEPEPPAKPPRKLKAVED